jgi:predicted metalloprotease
VTPAPRFFVSLLIAALVAVAATGCGIGADGTDTAGGERRISDIIRDAIEEAKERNRARVGDAGGQRQGESVLRRESRTDFDYAQYQNTLKTAIGLLEEYWTQAMPQAYGVQYTAPSRYVYYRSDEEQGPSCGGERAPARNAFYCPAGDFIAWDESGLMIPYYVQGGDFAAAFVLAHEFGHAMQMRLPQRAQLGVLRELQADCFAGAWSRWVDDRGLLQAGDLDEAVGAVFSARDVPGTPFTDPRAHGSGFQRTRAFGDGYEGGPSMCHPIREGAWVVSKR